ncbi:MAG: DUF2283 domain-containing protein [Chloroflexota bacterium]|nr:DUF2283 domain-containing protein [Chloroflexota bacterium]
MKLQISYFKDTDTLSIWNGEPAREADDVAENLIIDMNASGSPVGLTLEHAAQLSLPELIGSAASPELYKESFSNPHPSPTGVPDRREDIKLHIDYHQQSDTLRLGNGLPAPNGEDIAEYVTAFFDNEDRPNAVVIEHAAEILLPVLQAAMKASEEGSEKPAKASS